MVWADLLGTGIGYYTNKRANDKAERDAQKLADYQAKSDRIAAKQAGFSTAINARKGIIVGVVGLVALVGVFAFTRGGRKK